MNILKFFRPQWLRVVVAANVSKSKVPTAPHVFYEFFVVNGDYRKVSKAIDEELEILKKKHSNYKSFTIISIHPDYSGKRWKLQSK